MDEKQARIVEAAVRVISRYGVKRTTMQDIAEEAGIVRQTLYNIYKNKDDILRATIAYFAEDARASIRAGWSDTSGLGDRLDLIFRHTIVRPYEVTHASPEADDIVSGFNAAAREDIAREGERDRALIEEALKPHEAALQAAGLDLYRCSDLIQRSAHGIKKSASSVSHLHDLLGSLKTIILAVIAGAQPPDLRRD